MGMEGGGEGVDTWAIHQLCIIEESGWPGRDGGVHAVLLRQHLHRGPSLWRAGEGTAGWTAWSAADTGSETFPGVGLAALQIPQSAAAGLAAPCAAVLLSHPTQLHRDYAAHALLAQHPRSSSEQWYASSPSGTSQTGFATASPQQHHS